MSGHIRKSTFNDNNNQSSDLFTGTIISKKDLPAYATVGALNDSTLRTRPHTPDTFNSQIKRNKEVATSLDFNFVSMQAASYGTCPSFCFPFSKHLSAKELLH